jgi:serine/threonine-protein kinase RsbW
MRRKELNKLFSDVDVHSVRKLEECPSLIENLINEIAEKLHLIDDERYELQVAVTEICYNGIKHGNRCCPDKEVLVSYLILKDRIIFRVEDQGEGFDTSKIPDPTREKNILKPRGRGIFLARCFCNELIFEDKGRRVFIVKKIKST